MDGWRRDLQAAGIGMLAATALELAASAWNTAPSTRARALGRVLMAGAVATAYERLIPPSVWGVKSGFSFAQLPPVVSLHTSAIATPRLRLGIWGALTGLAMYGLRD